MKQRIRQLLGENPCLRVVDQVMLILFVASFSACSQSAGYQDKIVGTWEAGAFGISVQQLYSSDGTFRLIIPGGPTSTGTWAIQDDRLTMTVRDGTKSETIVVKIITLDDSVLIYEGTDKAGKTMASTWKRVK